MGNQLNKLGVGWNNSVFHFDKWIEENGFHSIKQLLIRNNMVTLENLITLDHTNFDSMLMQNDKISQSPLLKMSLIVAIQKLKDIRKHQRVFEKMDIVSNLHPTDSITHRLHNLYDDNIKEIEKAYSFQDFHTPYLSKSDFVTKPMILLVGQYSTGKTSLIQYLIGEDFPGCRIGPEPTTDAFYAVMYGKQQKLIPGWAATINPDKPFQTLPKFGDGFLNKFSNVTILFLINNCLIE